MAVQSAVSGALSRASRLRLRWMSIFCARKLTGFAICTPVSFANGKPLAADRATLQGAANKDFDVAQVLRRNATHPLCCALFPPPAHGTTYQRCKKFRVEMNAWIGQSIVGSGRSVISQKLGFKVTVRGTTRLTQ
jgi:hypothetical protein